MTTHRCTNDADTCPTCADMIDAAIEARTGMPRNHTQRDLDWLADAQAANEWASRGGY